MPKMVTGLVVAALSIGAAPGIAQSAATSPSTQELAAQANRPRITIFPRHYLPPNARRQCFSWLVTEYRVSGPVIVPQMRCWWQY